METETSDVKKYGGMLTSVCEKTNARGPALRCKRIVKGRGYGFDKNVRRNFTSHPINLKFLVTTEKGC